MEGKAALYVICGSVVGKELYKKQDGASKFKMASTLLLIMMMMTGNSHRDRGTKNSAAFARVNRRCEVSEGVRLLSSKD